MEKNYKKYLSTPTIVISIVFLIIGFAAGFFYQKSKTPNFASKFGNQTGQMMGNRNTSAKVNSPRSVIGEIINADEKSITVKSNDGSSKIILLSSKTQIAKASTAQSSDLKIGEKVSVFGQTNTDGSVSADNIQLNPQIKSQTTK